MHNREIGIRHKLHVVATMQSTATYSSAEHANFKCEPRSLGAWTGTSMATRTNWGEAGYQLVLCLWAKTYLCLCFALTGGDGGRVATGSPGVAILDQAIPAHAHQTSPFQLRVAPDAKIKSRLRLVSAFSETRGGVFCRAIHRGSDTHLS